MNRLHSLVPCITLAAFGSLSLAAQRAQPTTTPAVPVQSTASAPEANNAQLRPVVGELVTRIDAKKAKPGQPIVIKVTKKSAIANGVVIPKGSKILGHVTDVQPHTKKTPNSKVTLQFDKAQLKGGQTLPIKSVIESIAPAYSAANVSMTAGGMPAAGGAPETGAATGASPAGSTGMAPNPGAPAQASTMPTDSASQSSAAPTPGTVVARQGNIAVKTTSVPGVLLATNVNGQPFSNASGALLGAKRNVDLDGGTKVTLAVANVPANGR